MKAILLAFCGLFFFGVGDASAHFTAEKALNLNPKCAEGPTFWCTNLKNADSCGALTHCIKTRSWPKYPVDGDSICQICLDMVKQARDQLQSNETQEELREVFEGTCAFIRIKKIREECDKLADDYEVQLVEMLTSQMDPNTVCSVAGLCNNAEIDRELKHSPNAIAVKPIESTGLTCKQCGKVSDLIVRKFDQTDRDQFLENVLSLCGRMSSFSDGCSAIVLSYYNDVYAHLKTNLNSENICHMAGVCADQYHQHEDEIKVVPLSEIGFVENIGDDIPCDLCKQLITHLRDLLVANTTESEFKNVLEGICKQTKTFKSECISLADQYYDVIYDRLTKELDPEGACFMIGICPKGSAQQKFDPIMPLIPNEQLLSKKKIVLGADEPKFTAKEIQSFQLPKDVLLLDVEQIEMHTLQKKGNQFCTLCEYFLHFVQDSLASPKTEENIKEAVLNACHKLPKDLQGQCQGFVDMYGDAIIALLIQDLDPSQICPKLAVCIRTTPASNEKCPLCLFLVQDLVEQIKQDRSKENIENKLHVLCDRLRDDLKAECIDFVNTYTKELVDKLADDFTPREICLYFKLCTEKEETLIEHIGVKADFSDYLSNTVYKVDKEQSAPECLLCERLIKEVERKIAKDKSKDHIKKVLEQACSSLPKQKLRNKCHAAIEKETDFIVDLLLKEVTPKEVCMVLGFCIGHEVMQKSVEIIESTPDTPPCRLCQIIVTKIEEQLNNKTAQEDIEKCVKHVCETLPKKLRPKCRQMIDEYADEIIKHLPNDPPKKVCTDACICKSDIQSDESKDDDIEASPECILCEQLVHRVEEKVKDNKSKEHIKQVLEQACSSFHKENLKEKCLEVVEKDSDYIIDAIIKNVSPKEICSGLGFCAGKKSTDDTEIQQIAERLMQKYADTPQCVICELFMTKLENNLKKNATQDEIEKTVRRICSAFPAKLAGKCKKFVEDYADLVISLVSTVPPKELCGEINLCRENIKKDTNHRDVMECGLCNTATDALAVVLDKHGPKDREIVCETTCHLLPAKYYDSCMEFMGIYIESLTNLINRAEKRSEICVQVGKCFRDGDNSMFVEIRDGLSKSTENDDSSESTESHETEEKPKPKRLLGASPCTFGPSYWCSSDAAINECNAHTFCNKRNTAAMP